MLRSFLYSSMTKTNVSIVMLNWHFQKKKYMHCNKKMFVSSLFRKLQLFMWFLRVIVGDFDDFT